MQNDQKSQASDAAGDSPAAPKSASRRRLLRAGIGAAPAVLTVASLPVRAGNCRSASASASMNAGGVSSSNVLQPCGTGGWNSYWKTLACASWPDTCRSWSSSSGAWIPMPFSTCLGGPAYSSINGGKTNSTPNLLDVLTGTGTSDIDKMARNLTGAYLNCEAGMTPTSILTSAQVRAMWAQAYTSSYIPNGSSKPWSPADVNTWVTSTFFTT